MLRRQWQKLDKERTRKFGRIAQCVDEIFQRSARKEISWGDCRQLPTRVFKRFTINLDCNSWCWVKPPQVKSPYLPTVVRWRKWVGDTFITKSIFSMLLSSPSLWKVLIVWENIWQQGWYRYGEVGEGPSYFPISLGIFDRDRGGVFFASRWIQLGRNR